MNPPPLTKVPQRAPHRQSDPLLGPAAQAIGQLLSGYTLERGTRTIRDTEQALAKALGVPSCVGVTNASVGVSLIVRAWGLRPGDEVLVPAYGPMTLPSALAWNGLTLKFVDVDPTTGNPTPGEFERAIGRSTRALLVQNPYGQRADLESLRKMGNAKGLQLLEDATNSLGLLGLGTEVQLVAVHSQSVVSLPGEAAFIVTRQAPLVARIRALQDEGRLLKDYQDQVGIHGKLDPLQARLFSLKIPMIQKWLNQRKNIAGWYLSHLSGLENHRLLQLPKARLPHGWSHFPIRVPAFRRAQLVEKLKRKGIECHSSYPTPLPKLPAFQRFSQYHYPQAEALASETIQLPLFAELSGTEINYVISTVSECLTHPSTWSSFPQ